MVGFMVTSFFPTYRCPEIRKLIKSLEVIMQIAQYMEIEKKKTTHKPPTLSRIFNLGGGL